jgi:hypothetical protein
MPANTNFTAGQVLTAAQQNNFPRGQMVYTENTTAQFPIGTEAVAITTASFTAVANRRYRITYFEPGLQNNSGGTPVNTMRIRLSSISGTILVEGYNTIPGATAGAGRLQQTLSRVVQFSAGGVVLVATLASPGNVMVANRGPEAAAHLLVEDIGLA